MSETPDDWVEETAVGYSASRYDLETCCTHCQECGTELEGYGTQRSGGSTWCPGCEVLVFAW